jgi:hypothetical protein
MTERPRPTKRLSAAEALRALYIDFEGRKEEPPVLLGIHRRGRGARPYVQQDVVDPVFAGLVPRYLPLHDCVENVVRRAEHGDRRIVSWSQHDLDVERFERFEARHVNALAVAKRWRNRCHGGDKPAEGTLANYLALIGYAVPGDAEPGHVGDTIRDLRPRLTRGLPVAPLQQARWDRLVEHNRFDCAGMRAVCLRASRDPKAQAPGQGHRSRVES